MGSTWCHHTMGIPCPPCATIPWPLSAVLPSPSYSHSVPSGGITLSHSVPSQCHRLPAPQCPPEPHGDRFGGCSALSLGASHVVRCWQIQSFQLAWGRAEPDLVSHDGEVVNGTNFRFDRKLKGGRRRARRRHSAPRAFGPQGPQGQICPSSPVPSLFSLFFPPLTLSLSFSPSPFF